MKQVKSFVWLLLAVVVLVGGGAFMVSNYSWVFSKRVKGKILAVKRVTEPTAILGSKITAEQLHSYSVLIQGDDGELHQASSEDRQWEVATAGYCAEALFYRYPFWDLKNAGTFFNARLLKLVMCDGQAVPANPAGQPPAVDGLKEPAVPAPGAGAPTPPAAPGK